MRADGLVVTEWEIVQLLKGLNALKPWPEEETVAYLRLVKKVAYAPNTEEWDYD